jgi:DNA-binding NarL/FixJ family response regulator
VKLFVLDPHTIYRTGVVESLESMPAVESVAHAATVEEARRDPSLRTADLVILDPAARGSGSFIGAVDARVIVCSSDCAPESVLTAIRAGAAGYLRKDTLTDETLGAAVAAAANGLPAEATERRPPAARLTEREQQVLSLIAAGHPTREVAQQLCYSERTVKNVLHAVVTKLNARSRSQAVASAVREGLI